MNISYGKMGVAALCTLYFLAYAANPSDWHFLDGVSLIIHEAGHFVFAPFGQTLEIAGGSLLQTLIPLLFAGYFLRRQEFFSASLLLFWVGQNLLNVSVYAGDAVTMQLPLLGGDNVIHDWNWLMVRFGLLPKTAMVAATIRTLGTLVILAAAGTSLWLSRKQPTEAVVE